jgi:hypothetical protein
MEHYNAINVSDVERVRVTREERPVQLEGRCQQCSEYSRSTRTEATT